jgi:ribosomal protein S18 acetylase RimI-like enzyme
MPGLRFAGRARTAAGPRRAPETLRFDRTWVRLAPWRGDDQIAHLVVASDGTLRSPAIAQCIDRARELGYSSMLTNALGEHDLAPFAGHGFTVHERLHLLTLDFATTPPRRVDAHVGGPVVGRISAHEHEQVLALDVAAFSAFWRLGAGGLRDALDATPRSRFRTTRHDEPPTIAGYAITGVAGTDGYLQRIAVDPAVQSRGHGGALVDDALEFLWREGVHRAHVNTQLQNDRALALYRSRGFTQQPSGLAVLGRTL